MSDLVGNPGYRFSRDVAQFLDIKSNKQLMSRAKIQTITKTSPCNEGPLTLHFYILKQGFTRVYIFFLFLLQNVDCGYSLEPPHFKKSGDILVSACPYVCMYVCMHSCSRYRLETSCMDSSLKNSRRIFLVFLNYLPLLNYGPLTNKGMKFCKCRISKSIIATNLKLVSADRG